MRTFDLLGDRFYPEAMQFSPDGRLLAIQTYGWIDVLDVTNGSIQSVNNGSTGKVGTAGVGFTADSRALVYFHDAEHSVRSFDLETSQDYVLRPSRQVAWTSRSDVSISAPAPAGRLVFAAVHPEKGTVEVVALDTISGEQQFSFARHRSYLRELAVSPDGNWVVGCSTKDIRLWGIGNRRPKRADWHHQDLKHFCYGNLALARDAAYLAVGGFRGHGRVEVWDLHANEKLDLSGCSVSGGGVAFAPDRPLLAFTQEKEKVGEVVLWDAKSRTELRRFDWGLGRIGAVAFSPDGFRCSTANSTHAVVWDVDV